jgi:hypothetical protein
MAKLWTLMKMKTSMTRTQRLSTTFWNLRYVHNCLRYQHDVICLQQPSWASPKGPAALFDDDDTEYAKDKVDHKVTSMLFLDSDLEGSPMIKEQKRAPAKRGPLGSLPCQGRPRQASKPKKNSHQDANELKVFYVTFFAHRSLSCGHSLETKVGRASSQAY